LNATYSQALRAATNSIIGVTAGIGTRPGPACYGSSTSSAGSISAKASSPSDRKCRTRHPRSSSPYSEGRSFRLSTGCDGGRAPPRPLAAASQTALRPVCV